MNKNRKLTTKNKKTEYIYIALNTLYTHCIQRLNDHRGFKRIYRDMFWLVYNKYLPIIYYCVPKR